MMMKKVWISIWLLLLTTALLMGLSSCGEEPSAEKKIVAMNFAGYDFAAEILGRNNDRISLEYLPAGGGHSFNPTVRDRVKIENSDLFIYVGGESDAAVEPLLKGKEQGVFRLMDCVELLCAEDHDHSHGDEHHDTEYDEHVWTSPKNALAIVEGLCEAICLLNPDYAETYRQNAVAYGEHLAALDRDFEELFRSVEDPTLVFGDRFPFLYFAKAYGISYYAAFPGCNSSTEPSFHDVIELVTLMKKEGYSTVFYIEGSSHTVADRLAEETLSKTALFHSCHKVSLDEVAEGVTYLALMQENLATLRCVFGK